MVRGEVNKLFAHADRIDDFIEHAEAMINYIVHVFRKRKVEPTFIAERTLSRNPLARTLVRAASTLVSALLLCHAEAPRATICLNGAWGVILNAEGGAVPRTGWKPRRVPALPLVDSISVWYRYNLRVPAAWITPDRRFLLKVGKAGHYTALYWNGRKMGEHYGQFTPFEIDVTPALRAGSENEIALFVHNASGQYAHPGADVTDPLEGNAFRGATDNPAQRNWVGIVGDIELQWRPKTHIREVFVIPSVRHKLLIARVEAEGPEVSGLMLRASVLDEGKVVLRLPDKPVRDGSSKLEAEWTDPILWGPASYGQPKLYTLRTELLRKGMVVDRSFTRFGFREVWIEGRDVLLNGKRLWMVGTYFSKLAPIRYINDGHPQAQMLAIMQESGLNTLNGHWDELGETWLDLCDEMGVLVLGGFYCDGRPQIQSKAGPGWADFMLDTCRRWVRTVRNHPSIVVWRPADDPMPPSAPQADLIAGYIREVRAEDGTRPVAFNSLETNIVAYGQSSKKDPRNVKSEYDDGSIVAQKLALTEKPLLTKELWPSFADVQKTSLFFRQFYEKSWNGRSVGILVQHLPLIARSAPFAVAWLSESGPGNRDTSNVASVPNWCDPARPSGELSSYGRLFAELYRQYVNQKPVAERRQQRSELLVTGLKPDEPVMLRPRDETVAEVLGVRAAVDGTAWMVVPGAGEYVLSHDGRSKAVRLTAQLLKPGYDSVERIAVSGK